MIRPNLDAIEAEANAATKGPWTVEHEELSVDQKEFWVQIPAPNFFLDMTPLVGPDLKPYEPIVFEWSDNTTQYIRQKTRTTAVHDATFMANSRTNVPALCAYIRHLETRLEILTITEDIRQMKSINSK